jgi:hypothetical protein
MIRVNFTKICDDMNFLKKMSFILWLIYTHIQIDSAENSFKLTYIYFFHQFIATRIPQVAKPKISKADTLKEVMLSYLPYLIG